jgi:hypothetical protein
MRSRSLRRGAVLSTAATLLAFGFVVGACTTIETIYEVPGTDAATVDSRMPLVESDASDESVTPPTNDTIAPSAPLAVTPARVTSGAVELRVTATDVGGIANVTIYQRDGSVLKAFGKPHTRSGATSRRRTTDFTPSPQKPRTRPATWARPTKLLWTSTSRPRTVGSHHRSRAGTPRSCHFRPTGGARRG